MSIRLRLTTSTTIPIRVEGILPETTEELSINDIARMPAWRGNRSVELGDLFSVADTGDSNVMEWEGDLTSVHWIGSGMTRGKILVDGSVGRHLGSEMTGGMIGVSGNAGDFAGCQMQGGSIHIRGDAADWLAAAYPGSKSGTNRGTIIVDGNAGDAAGYALRRGTIWIGGNSGRLVGWNMRGGTIAVGGRVGAMAGKGIVRGSLLLISTASAQDNRYHLPLTYTRAGIFRPVILNHLADWLASKNITLGPETQQFQLFHGDHLKGGRGEVFIAAKS